MRIAGPMTLHSGTTSGTPKSYALPPSEGGSTVKTYHIDVRVVASGSSNVKVAAKLRHGPDLTLSTVHSTVIASTQITTTPPIVLAGDADNTKILGECLFLVLEIDSATNGETWVTLEVHELRKPF